MTYSLLSAPYESVNKAIELGRYYAASALLDPTFFQISVRDGDSSLKKKFCAFFNKTVAKQQEKFFDNQQDSHLKGIYDASQKPPHPAKELFSFAVKNAPQILTRASAAFNPVFAFQLAAITLLAAGLADENIRNTLSDQLSHVAHYFGVHQDGPANKSSFKDPSP